MATFDFDFLRYVERRKGAREAQSREGAAYAYRGDLKVLRTLDRLKPVKLALEGTVRLWRGSARAELLGPSVKVTEKQQPKVHAAGIECAEKLHIAPPTIHVTPAAIPGGIVAYTFGTEEDAVILLHASLVERLSAVELADVVGRECGHLQNGHAVFRTARYFLTHSAGTFVRWIVAPAVLALSAWSRRADLSADRAGLLCSRDLETSVKMIEAILAPALLDGDAADREKQVAQAIKERTLALRLFAGSAYYTGLTGAPSGPSSEECDAQVGRMLK